MMDNKGKFVVVEGIDKSGKGTLIENLRVDYLIEDDWVYTKEPSDGWYGRKVRESLSDDNKPTPADFYLFLADRYQHIEDVIKPALNEGKNVLCDRYHLSTIAYQSRVIDEQMGIIDPIKYIDEMTGHFVIEPDLTLYIDIPVETAMDRLSNGKMEKYEKRSKLKEAKRIYDYNADNHENIIRLDGERPEKALTHKANTVINEY